ncbi:plant UBX domain-containing protein 10 [Selaginella moellendorffii]|uniref:plant UBX domain-containing protein 10 n=1 Tax=Selaginella moellendorffii TaxID=88036 RepID=UPI000D1C28CD|nr:plant UBX domain-containing protein 10 [Selaginella moellendorffii]|eukprot:XP_024527752.1 plant UBX domain-containing protein 10 [Selaginella moellendorffii]
MDQGSGGGEASDEKLAHFQSLTGMEDMAVCTRILERHGWDLDSAVTAAVSDDSHSHAREYSRQNLQPQRLSPRYSPSLPHRNSGTAPPLGLAQLATTSGDEDMLVDHQPRPGPIPPSNDATATNSGNLVWKIVTLPFSIVRGGLFMVSGAMGLGVWVAGSLLSYSLGALGIGNQQGGGGRLTEARDRFLPVPTAGAVQAIQFIRSFEQEYGSVRPDFQALSFMEALRRSTEGFKFLFVYLHSPEHVDTPAFCQATLCSEPVSQFLSQNFVVWGADVRNTEGFQMFNSLKASTFPFCAVVMASSNQRIALLQQVEGFKSPETLLSLLQRVLEEQGAALVAMRVEDEERRRNRQLREEQDAAYQAALLADQERERKRVEEAERVAREAAESERQMREKELAAQRAAQVAAEKQAAMDKLRKEKALALGAEPERGPQVTQVLVRFPNGERKERRFSCTSAVQCVYDFVDSLGSLGDARYSLVSNFPRKVYGADKLHMSLADAGLHPHASLFVQVDTP